MENKDEIKLEKREENIVKKEKKTFDLKLFYLTSELPLEKITKELIEKFSAELEDVPYARFNKCEGQLILNLNSETLKNENIDKLKENGIEIDGKKISVSEINEEQKSDFWKNHGKHFEGIFKNKYKGTLLLKADGLVKNNKDGFFLGYQRFKNISALKSFFSSMLKKYEVGTEISEEDQKYLTELVKYHSNPEKFKNIKEFKVNLHPEYETTKCFFIVNEDGKEDDFSYIKCIKNISSN